MSKKKLTRKGTGGRVYGGDPDLVHIQDGQRTAVGRYVADYLSNVMRAGDPFDDGTKPLCPGCYMVALFNAAVWLAKESGQPLSELGRSMGAAFANLATCQEGDDACIEEIAVKLDEGELS